MELGAKFVQTVSGLDEWGHDIIFEFKGDDDFWLYVDGELVIDLGGIHSALGGKVTYRNWRVFPNSLLDDLNGYCDNIWFTRYLKHKFPDIKVYWIVEECGFEIYCTNDKEGKYFPERFWVDTCIDGSYNSEYFETKEQVYEWLNKLTLGRVKCEEDVTNFNADYENDGADENFIYVHEFDIDR
jgi:fibro-slime domain-containing protein